MSGKVGRPRKSEVGVVGWTEKQVWQPLWVGIGFSFIPILLAILCYNVSDANTQIGFLHNSGFVISGMSFLTGVALLVFSLTQSERLKVVKE